MGLSWQVVGALHIPSYCEPDVLFVVEPCKFWLRVYPRERERGREGEKSGETHNLRLSASQTVDQSHRRKRGATHVTARNLLDIRLDQ